MQKHQLQGLAEMAAGVMGGKLDRREVFKRGAALGLSAAVVGGMLKAVETSAQAEVGSTITEPAGLRKDLAGKTVKAILGASGNGTPFTQALAHELSAASHLVFACGRYEGIDQRVVDHAATRWRVVEVSLGDFVLNGGEVAALAMIEAIVRLVPGFMGNPASLAEESHGDDGLLEYPVYTKPASWRGLDVPDVLLSGHHGAIAAWRREQSERRTAERRPDLLG